MTSHEREPLAQRIEREFAQVVDRTALTLHYEARFFFVDDPERQLGPTPLGSATTADRSDDNLRNLAYKLIREDPTGLSVILAERQPVVVDVGLHKESGGLGASYPDETLILLRPA